MKIFDKTIGLFELALIALLIPIYHWVTFIIPTDIPAHAGFIIDFAQGRSSFPTNFLYYFTVYFLSFFSSKLDTLLLCSVCVLAIATFLKYLIVKKIIYSELSALYGNIEVVSSIVSFLLLFSFSLPSLTILSGNYYMLNYPPNVWHNSTTIFVMPFVILLFWETLKKLQGNNTTKNTLFISVLIVLNVLVKPSFLFVYLLVYPILSLKKYSFSKQFWINLTPIFFALFLVFIEYYFIYSRGSGSKDNNSIGINLFYVFKYYCGEFSWIVVFISTIFSSFFFPIVVLLLNRKLLKEDMVQFTVICTLIGIIIANSLIETGDRLVDGNFFWQTYMCSFLLFFVCILQLLKLIATHKMGWKAYRIEIGVFVLHFLMGILYFIYISETGRFN